MLPRAFYVIYWSAIAIVLAIFTTVVLIANASAHEAPSGLWRYDGGCCNNRDCAPISSRNVLAIRGVGYRVVLQAGDHPLVTETIETIIPFDKARPSGDSEYHACVGMQWDAERQERIGSRVRCLYITGGV